MISHLLKTVEFDRHYNLLRNIAMGIRCFVVKDTIGSSIWESGDSVCDAIDAIAVQDKHFDAHHKVSYINIDAENMFFQLELYTFSGEVAGQLEFVIKTELETYHEVSNREYISWVNSILRSAANGIEKELQLIQEMDGMAKELSDRYDELNLVYEAEDQVMKFEEAKPALEKLAVNCTDYLDVITTVLYMPDKDITILHERYTSKDLSTINDFIKNKLYQWTLALGKSGAFNNNHDYEQVGLDNLNDVKILSCPIIESGSKVVGILACAKAMPMADDFTNSDRNLLETISRKVTKIIQSSYDALTGLVNRAGFESFLENSLLSAKQGKGVSSLILLDLDQLQIINDVAGHAAGDVLLRKIAGLLHDEVRDTDMLARIGGDVFGLLLKNCELKKAMEIAEKIRTKISNEPYRCEEKRFDVTASIGIFEVNEITKNAAAALTCAEIACEASKEAGRNMVKVYHEQDQDMIERKGQLQRVNQIHKALREDRFVLYAQKILSLDEREDFHFEVLMRMLDDEGNIMAPGQFMPAAEQFGLMPQIDRWVVSNTLSCIAKYASMIQDKIGHIAINISGQSICQEGFTEFLVEQVNNCEISASQICFEITETAAIRNLDMAVSMIKSLMNIGCKLSLDDFGTGLSSFTYLKLLPVHFLKIDGSFVKEILNDPVSESMVTAIDQVGKVMGLKTIAEFVENDAIKESLEKIGIDYAQGYGVGKPIPIDEQIQDQISEMLNNEYDHVVQGN